MSDVAKFVGIALFPNAASAAVTAISGIRGAACPRTPLTPPGWVFAVVWPVLYLLLGVVMARMDVLRRHDVLRRLFALVIALNLWYVVFAPVCRPLAALVGIVAVLAAAAWLTVDVYRADVRSGRMMLPLCLWLAFATAISAKVWQEYTLPQE